MHKMIILALVLLGLSLVLILLALTLSKHSFNDREKASAFECGFDPFNSSRLPFSLRFYLIALIFLIFDVEIVLLIPTVKLMGLVTPISSGVASLFFILVLLLGLYYEWYYGALSWK